MIAISFYPNSGGQIVELFLNTDIPAHADELTELHDYFGQFISSRFIINPTPDQVFLADRDTERLEAKLAALKAEGK